MVRRRRPRVIPPPLLDDGRAADFAPLEEFSGNVAILLWRTLRSITLWTHTDPDEHKYLSNPGAYRDRRDQIQAAEIDRAIVPALVAAAELLDPSSDHLPERLADACVQIAAWATAAGARRTALEFAQAAALAEPRDARLALGVARAAGRANQAPRAESWCEHAIARARTHQDWHAYALAQVERAVLLHERSPRASEQSIRRARRTINRYALHVANDILQGRLAEIALGSRVEIDSEIRNGEPVFVGTRIPIHAIAQKLELGSTKEELLEDYPKLTENDLDLATRYAHLYPRRGRPPKSAGSA